MGTPRTQAVPVTRPRYPRMAAAGSAVTVTLVSLLGAVGLLPVEGASPPAYAGTPRQATGPDLSAITLSGSVSASLPRPPGTKSGPRAAAPVAALPPKSGDGKRVVFDMSEQRVWLVSDRDRVQRSYLVSGSLTDNLGPGSYQVYSKSRHAVGIDDSGTMQFMVRFTQGENAAIGFHDIPVRRGEQVQSRAQLGTPQSHGCIRQARPDAKALWAFAPVGTQVTVTA